MTDCLWRQVIHEFDPYFNYRTTKFLSHEGGPAFLNWFDNRAWYPLGRVIGGTVFPGLMATATAGHALLNAVGITLNIRNMCVFLAPLFAANTALASYLLVHEVRHACRRGATFAVCGCVCVWLCVAVCVCVCGCVCA